jgi:hypothetical protein
MGFQQSAAAWRFVRPTVLKIEDNGTERRAGGSLNAWRSRRWCCPPKSAPAGMDQFESTVLTLGGGRYCEVLEDWDGDTAMTNWATDRLNELVRADVVLPPVIHTLRLGALDSWGPGWIKKTWSPSPDLLNVDGSLFGGHLAALADQALTFAAMTRVPDGMMFRTLNSRTCSCHV